MPPMIQGDDYLELLQFFVDKKKSGLIVFAYEADLNQWMHKHATELLDYGCFYIPQMQTWRYQSVVVRLCVISEENEIRKVRGYRFDKVWYIGNVDNSVRRLIAVYAQQLPLTTTARKELTDGIDN